MLLKNIDLWIVLLLLDCTRRNRSLCQWLQVHVHKLPFFLVVQMASKSCNKYEGCTRYRNTLIYLVSFCYFLLLPDYTRGNVHSVNGSRYTNCCKIGDMRKLFNKGQYRKKHFTTNLQTNKT